MGNLKIMITNDLTNYVTDKQVLLAKEINERYLLLSSLDRIKSLYFSQALLYGNPSPYKYMTEEILQNFFSIFLKHKHGYLATCYQLDFSRIEINQLNKELEIVINSGNMHQVSLTIIKFIHLHENKLNWLVNTFKNERKEDEQIIDKETKIISFRSFLYQLFFAVLKIKPNK